MLTSVAQADFTPEQSALFDSFRESVRLISEQSSDVILGVKDIHSRHFIGTDAAARILALKQGIELSGRLDCEMPCEGTALYADNFVAEDRAMLAGNDIDKTIKILRIYHYSDGLNARVFTKHLLKHRPSHAALGVIYHARDICINDFLNIIPNYIMEFGVDCCIEQQMASAGGRMGNLTDYEQEICFLLLLNWDFGQIADFMNKYRPRPDKSPRVADSIIKSKNRICEKLGLPTVRLPELRDALIADGMQKRMPKTFFQRLIGSRVIG